MQIRQALSAERRVRQIAGIGYWTIDFAAGHVVWSKDFAQLLGYEDRTDGTISLRRHVASHHPRERRRLLHALRRGDCGTNGHADVTFVRRSRMLRRDGTVLDIVVHGCTVRDGTSGRPLILGIVFDVTDVVRFGRELWTSEMRLRTVLEHIDQGLVMTDAEGCVRVHNRRAAEMLGVPDGLLLNGAPLVDTWSNQGPRGEPNHAPAPPTRWLDDSDHNGIVDGCVRMRSDGTLLQVRKIPIPEGGSLQTFTDVTQRIAAETALRDSERRFRLLAENSNDIFILGAPDTRRLYVSPAVRTMLGYEPEELVGSRQLEHVHPEDADVFIDLWTKAQVERDGRFFACMRYRHKAGHYIWIEASVRAIREPPDGRAVGYVAVLRDITERHQAEERIRYLALHDMLTGLPNRALFLDRLGQAIAHGPRTHGLLAVLACDLDRFKAINDNLGHPAGDALLRIVADRMQAALRPYDTVARLGGDEFAVLLAQLDEPTQAARLAEQLIMTVNQPITIEGRSVEVGISIGFILASTPDVGSDELFKRADMALYEAKAAGGNTYREFEAKIGIRIALHSQLALDMGEAIRRGEFQLFYQPVVDAPTGTVVSFEALMRWKHPVRGEISPSVFIPLAEENGLIVPLGAWALREACREALTWPKMLRVGVNVSAAQFRGGLEEAVLAALAETGLPACRLKLEVTESVLMQDGEAVIACLHRLRALGVVIALDDFGTGYSSLSYLRRFPFDKIKIDRSFIRDIADPEAAAIVRAIVSIGERLGMGIVAEGVETREQLELVRREGCAQVQGFLFSVPLPAHEAALYLKRANIAIKI